jgi:hypothetical protein
MLMSRSTVKMSHFAFLLLLVTLIWALSGWFLYSDPNRGTFGDMFGAANSLFSGLAFAALIFTVWMQREELNLQRRELELTREEIIGQKQQMEVQNRTLSHQAFEHTFFELLQVHTRIVEIIDVIDDSGRVTKSRDCFRLFYKRLTKIFLTKIAQETPKDPLPLLKNIYLEFYEAHQDEIGHYFRHLYHIIKFVKNSSVEEKKRYTTFVRGQLSSYELALLFYSCLSELGSEKFKPLIEEFSLLKNLPTKLLLDETHKDLYASNAYDSSTL